MKKKLSFFNELHMTTKTEILDFSEETVQYINCMWAGSKASVFVRIEWDFVI